MTYRPKGHDVRKAYELIRTLFPPTPLEASHILSKRHSAHIFLKREDLTPVRSYKIRGAMNMMATLPKNSKVVTCSAGNHAQGVAYAAALLGHHATIFMPLATTKQKIDKVLLHGRDRVTVHLSGSNFDEAAVAASDAATRSDAVMVPPFDHPHIIEGQATVGMEIVEQSPLPLDYVFLPVGGGGLAAGVASYIKMASPATRIVGVEPTGAASLTLALKHNRPTPLPSINTFVDGAAVRQVGTTNFPLCRDYLDQVVTVDEGHVCSKILQIYNEHGYIVEPAGVLSLCALDLTTEILGRRVVAVLSGGNSDVFRMPEILERSLIYEEKKHYFRIEFPQRAGALKDFITSVLGPTDDIIYFKYIKLINRELGPVLIGIETKSKEDSYQLMERMKQAAIPYEKLTNLSDL